MEQQQKRFSALDVSASVSDLKNLIVGLRLQNVYDLSNKCYLFKFAKAGEQHLLLIESGLRFHLTTYAREKSNTPNNFAMKLRKHLRTKRLNEVSQLGYDRILDLRFGEGDTGIGTFHVIAEFYASGNIILTDHEYRILTLLRVVELEGASENTPEKPTEKINSNSNMTNAVAKDNLTRYAVGELYPVQNVKNFVPISESRLLDLLSFTNTTNDESKKKAKKKKDKDATLKRFVQSRLGPEYGASIVEHCLIHSGLDLSVKIGSEGIDLGNTIIVQKLFEAFKLGDAIVDDCKNGKSSGFVVEEYVGDTGTTEKSTEDPLDPSDASQNSKRDPKWIQTEFHPVLFSQTSQMIENLTTSRKLVRYQYFTNAVDEYFSHLESSRSAASARRHALSLQKKLEAAKAAHETQILNLVQAQVEREKQAQCIEVNLSIIDAVTSTIRGYLSAGMDWADLSDLVNDEKRKGNILALYIVGFKLDIGMVTLALKHPDDLEEIDESDDEDSVESENEESDEDSNEGDSNQEKTGDHHQAVVVDIDIYASAFANARRYYDSKKVAVQKHSKTIQASTAALETFERKLQTKADAVPQQSVPNTVTTKIRKPFWFERFLWFISSENYLIVGGKDATQNEMLVRKHLYKDDLYVHADLHGAASVIVKNLTSVERETFGIVEVGNDSVSVPESTLLQAATMSIVLSRAWDAKIVTSAWWVNASQVSKTAPTGEYLTTGSFMIRGKKNWLPPVQLVYGIGILFKVEEVPETIQRHYWERRPWGRGGVTLDNKFIENESSLDEEGKQDVSTHELTKDEGSVDEKHQQVDDLDEVESASAQENDEDNSNSDLDEKNNEIDEEIPNSEDTKTSEIKLSENLDIVDIKPEGEKTIPNQDSKGYLTAKQRRELKKKGSFVESSKNNSEPKKPVPKSNDPKTATPVRGKRSKLKKQKEKYADQDEEEKEVAMELLGVGKGAQPKGKKAKEKAKKQEILKERSERFEQQKTEQKNSNDKLETHSIATQERELHQNNQELMENNNEDEDILEATTAGGLSWLPFTDSITSLSSNLPYSYLDTLTGNPTASDVILHAVPVCGPWAAIQKYKYKAKLLPGTVKRGKAAKSVQSGFVAVANSIATSKVDGKKRIRQESLSNEAESEKERIREEEKNRKMEEDRGASARERDLIKVVTEQEFINVMIGKVKISIVGGEEEKKGKKSGKKK
ncbi:hypothetical protein HK096_011627 [Nowakowskiella sp. JEL0078]|nr:hypothetical protein HK096_011627 [Nowakowskiella sp. JEL0078]